MQLQVGVKALIKNSEGSYLLIRRSVPLADGTGIKWDIPGGRIEESEQLEDALAREIREEVGITLDGNTELLKAQDILLPHLNLHVVRLTYIVSLDSPVVLSEEHQGFQWVTLAQAVQLDTDRYLHEVLRSLS